MSCDEMSRRRRNPLPPSAAPTLEDEDLLTEILLRLPPQPSSLPRASVVSKRWRSLVSFPGFLRNFRIQHRRNPPVLGFFAGDLKFVPTMDPPNRVPAGRFSLHLDHEDNRYPWFRILGCRHGLVLIFLLKRLQVLVWDPVTGYQHRIAIPPGFAPTVHGAVIRATGDVWHFQVVMVGTVKQQHSARAVAQVYSSKTGIWGDLVSAPLPPINTPLPEIINTEVPGVLVEDSLYWSLICDSLLQFDLYRQRLSVIPKPVYGYGFSLMLADGGGLGCLVLSNLRAQLWKRKNDCDGVDSWVLRKTIELDKLLSINSEKMRWIIRIVGFAEDNNVVLLWTEIGLFTIHLESLQFKKLFKTNIVRRYHAFESVYTSGTVIGGEHDGAELLQKT